MLLGGGGSGAVGTAIISCGRARSGVVLLGGVFLQLAGVCPVAYCYMWAVSLNLCLRLAFSVSVVWVLRQVRSEGTELFACCNKPSSAPFGCELTRGALAKVWTTSG